MLGTIQGIGIFLCFFLSFKSLVNAVHIVILTVLPLWNGVVPYDKRVGKRIRSLLYGIMWSILFFLHLHGCGAVGIQGFLRFFKGIETARRGNETAIILIVAIVIEILSVGSLHNGNAFVIGFVTDNDLCL